MTVSPAAPLDSRARRPPLPPGYRARRGLNWGVVGLMYTSYYLCRYNFSLANKAISDEFGFSKAQIGTIISSALLAYACGQVINGLLVDKLGGKRAMLLGAAGTITMNLIFGVASFWGMLGLFIVIRSIDGYMQSFGGSGFVKINAAWFSQRERGTFAGIFGFMINLGRFFIFTFGPPLLAGLCLGGGPLFLGQAGAEIAQRSALAWILCYGCALHAAGFFMPRGIKVFGWLFMGSACGLYYAFRASGIHHDATQAHWLMGAFFGGLHLAYGGYLYLTERENPVA